MAKLSRNQRHKARQRRTLSMLKREFRKLYSEHQNIRLLLIGILRNEANIAGSIELGGIGLSEEVVKDVLANYGTYAWQSKRDEKTGVVTVSLVDNRPAAGAPVCPGDGCPGCAACNSATITVIPEDADDPGPDVLDEIADLQAVAQSDVDDALAPDSTDGQ